MGTSTSAAEFAGKMNKIATTLPRSAERGIRDAGASAQRIIYQEAARKGVLPSSKIAKRPWSVSNRVRGGARPTAFVAIRGPFHLVESKTQAHVIVARRLATRTAARKRTAEIALSGTDRVAFGSLRAKTRTRRNGDVVNVKGAAALTVGSNLRAYAYHPGTRGKGIFAAAKPRILTQAPRDVFGYVVDDMAGVLAA